MPRLTCPDCGHVNPPIIPKCINCGHTFTHRDCFPEQYKHPLAGRRVAVRTGHGYEHEGTVERVVVSQRFGPLVLMDNGDPTAWSVKDCTPIEEAPCQHRDANAESRPSGPATTGSATTRAVRASGRSAAS